MPGRAYFATRNDLLLEFKKIENIVDIQYVSCERTEDINILIYNSFEDIPLVDQAMMDGIYTMSNPYMIIPKGGVFDFTTIHLSVNPYTTQYEVDISKNINYIKCTFGGWYKLKDELVFIGGFIGTYKDTTQYAKQLYKTFSRNFCNKFVTINDWEGSSWKIGPEALDILRSGARFITDYWPSNSDPSHDLKMPSHLK